MPMRQKPAVLRKKQRDRNHRAGEPQERKPRCRGPVQQQTVTWVRAICHFLGCVTGAAPAPQAGRQASGRTGERFSY